MAVSDTGNTSGSTWLCYSYGCTWRVFHQLTGVSASGSVEYTDTRQCI